MAEIQQKSESSDSSSGISDLPSSIVLEILVKLPIKSVIRCRCVCKNWNDLISESHFATLYFKNPPFTVLVKFRSLIIQDHFFCESSSFIEIGLNGDKMCTPFNPKTMNFQSSETLRTEVHGSCNGLLCLVQSPLVNCNYDFNNEAIYIINPLLGEVMMLPQVNQSEDMAFAFYGFGFSTHSHHYKVLRVVNRRGRHHGEIITIGVDHKWRSFEDSSLPFAIFSRGVNLNGVFYLAGNKGSSYILAFDMEEERGHRIPLPSEFRDSPHRIVLVVCNDNLCLSDNGNEHQVVIWTMKQYGVVESWSTEIILKSWIPFDLSYDRLIPMTRLRNGDLLMSLQDSLYDDSEGLISYSPKTNECRTLDFSDGEKESSYVLEKESSYVLVHVPSFFPLSNVL